MEESIFINPKQLSDIIKNVVIFDCRYRLTDKNYGISNYISGHIPGAFLMDINEDMASEVKSTGGRHPLPDLKKFKEKLEQCGIYNETSVVCYDDNLSGAARLWFLLRYFGITNSLILEDGIDGWISDGFSLESGNEVRKSKGNITLHPKNELLATYEDLLDVKSGTKVIDAREEYRFRGESEPIDKIPGRIPNSINIPYTELMDGVKLKNADSIKKLLKDTHTGDIIYCGSGVTSCINYVAMVSIGLEPKLYIGSYSDWISRGMKIEKS
jgi:thiosulfate/3-mercaptopyruvate sulfurtransferase